MRIEEQLREMLDEDQKEYLRRNAKAFLAARKKKIKRRYDAF